MKRLIQTDIDKSNQQWSIVPLQSIIKEPQYGYTASAANKGNVRFLRITDINGFSIDWQRVPFCQCDRDQFDKYRLSENDILFARIGATTGKSYIVKRAPDAIFASYLIRVRTNGKTDPDYLYFFFQSDAYWRQINENKNNNLKKGVNASILKSIEVPLPPTKNEQRRIADILATVQRAIELQVRLIDLTKELKKVLMHKLFTEGTCSEPRKETEIGPVPESWEVIELGKTCIVQTGIAKGRKIDPYDAVTLPYLRVANVQDGYLDLSEMKEITLKKTEIERYSLKEGDVVLTEGGDLDKLGRGFIWHNQIECCVHQNHVFAVRTNTSMLSPEFLAYQVQSPYGKAYFLSVAHKTTNLACINTSKLKGLPLLIPSRKEQKEIIDILSTVDKKQKWHSKRLDAFKDLFRTLLNQLMTAQIRVNGIDLSELGLEEESTSFQGDFQDTPNFLI